MKTLTQYINEASSDINRLNINDLKTYIDERLYSPYCDIDGFSDVTEDDFPEGYEIVIGSTNFVIEIPTFQTPNITAYKYKRNMRKIGGAGGWGGRKILQYGLDSNTSKKMGYSSEYTKNDWIADKMGAIVANYLKSNNYDIPGGYSIKCTKVKNVKNIAFDCKALDDYIKKELPEEYKEDVLNWNIAMNKNAIVIDIQLETGKGYSRSHNKETYEYNLTGEGYLTTQKLNTKNSVSDSTADRFIYELNWYLKVKHIPVNQRPSTVIINTYQNLE